MKVLTGMAATLAAAITVFGASQSAAQKWDMALAYSSTNYHSQNAAAFAKEVTENSDLEIVTHSGGSLFGGSAIFGAVRKGLVPIGERLISALGNDNAIYEVDSVPFLATSFADARKLDEASRPALVNALKKARVQLLYTCPWPPQGFYSVNEVNSAEDLAGLKFRAYNATTSDMASGLGMVPTKIEAAELSQAFATGVAQSMISSGSTGYDRKLWEHVDYYYDVKAWLPRNMVIVNNRAWGQLSADTQKVVRAAAATAENNCWARAEELDNWYIEQFKMNGMEVDTLNPLMDLKFKSVGGTLRDAWLLRAGSEGRDIIQAYQGK